MGRAAGGTRGQARDLARIRRRLDEWRGDRDGVAVVSVGLVGIAVIQLTAQMRILVAGVDFRAVIDRLAQICQAQLAVDPFCGWLFVFCNRRRTAVKILTYDGQGFWLATKRLSQGKFPYWTNGRTDPGAASASAAGAADGRGSAQGTRRVGMAAITAGGMIEGEWPAETQQALNISLVLNTKGNVPGTLNARWTYQSIYSGKGLATGGPKEGFADHYHVRYDG